MLGFVQNPDDLNTTTIHNPVEHQVSANKEIEITSAYLVTGLSDGGMLSEARKCVFQLCKICISLLATPGSFRVPGDFSEIDLRLIRNP